MDIERGLYLLRNVLRIKVGKSKDEEEKKRRTEKRRDKRGLLDISKCHSVLPYHPGC